MDLRPALFVAADDHPLDQQLHEFAARAERLFGVLFYFGEALPERDQPRVRGLGDLSVLALLGEVGFYGVDEKPEVVGLVLEVGEVHL